MKGAVFMAATVTIVKRSKYLNRKVTIADVALDNSYPTGGEAVTPSQFGLSSIDQVIIDGGNGYRPQFDYTNNKIKVYTSAGTETTNTTDLSALTLRVQAVGQ